MMPPEDVQQVSVDRTERRSWTVTVPITTHALQRALATSLAGEMGLCRYGTDSNDETCDPRTPPQRWDDRQLPRTEGKDGQRLADRVASAHASQVLRTMRVWHSAQV